jgi:hypothetical protein
MTDALVRTGVMKMDLDTSFLGVDRGAGEMKTAKSRVRG